jgi:hypothetical protein
VRDSRAKPYRAVLIHVHAVEAAVVAEPWLTDDTWLGWPALRRRCRTGGSPTGRTSPRRPQNSWVFDCATSSSNSSLLVSMAKTAARQAEVEALLVNRERARARDVNALFRPSPSRRGSFLAVPGRKLTLGMRWNCTSSSSGRRRSRPTPSGPRCGILVLIFW